MSQQEPHTNSQQADSQNLPVEVGFAMNARTQLLRMS